jgi:hypothetical protein
MSSAEGRDETSPTASLGSLKVRRERPADRRGIPRHPRRRHPRSRRRASREKAVAENAAAQSLWWSEDDQEHDPRHVAPDDDCLSQRRIRPPPVRLGPPRRFSPGDRGGRRRRVHRLRGARRGAGRRLHALASIPVPPPRSRRTHRHRGAGVVGSALTTEGPVIETSSDQTADNGAALYRRGRRNRSRPETSVGRSQSRCLKTTSGRPWRPCWSPTPRRPAPGWEQQRDTWWTL